MRTQVWRGGGRVASEHASHSWIIGTPYVLIVLSHLVSFGSRVLHSGETSDAHFVLAVASFDLRAITSVVLHLC